MPIPGLDSLSNVPNSAMPFKINTLGRDSGTQVCGQNANTNAYFDNSSQEFGLINYGDRIFLNNQPFAGGSKFYGIREIGTGQATHYIRISNTGYVISPLFICKGVDDDSLLITLTPTTTPAPVPTPTVTPAPIAVPSSDVEYNYFTVLNESYSKKIFGYYSGSANFRYLFDAEKTGSSESNDPTTGKIFLNKGKIATTGSNDEIDSTKLIIDVKTSSSRENIVNYLSTLSGSIDSVDRGTLKIRAVDAPTHELEFTVGNIETHPTSSSPADAILADGWFEINISSGNSSEGDNALSSSLAFLNQSASYDLPVEVQFYNDALLGYHEIEIPGSGSTSFVAAIEQTSSLKSGSISGPFNTSWGISESEFLATDYFPSAQGSGYMWNDGYKAKHIKLNNRADGGDILSQFVRKSEWSNFVLYNPKNANNNKLYTANGNYSEQYILDNATRYVDYTHLKVDQVNILTSFAVNSENFAQTDFNLEVNGRYIVYATSSGTVTFPTASNGINKSIPQGYFPATLATEQYFRGWDDANYYVGGNLISTYGDYTDKLRGFNSGSTERDKDNAPNYVAHSVPFFIDATSSFITVPSESIIEFNNQSNLTQIGPTFQTADGNGQQKYFYKEDTGEIVISGSEHIDTKKSSNLIYDRLYDVELVAPGNSTVYYDTPEGFTVTIEPSQSLWLTRGISPPGTLDGDIWKYNRFLHRPFKAYILTSTGSYIKGYSEEVYGEVVYREGPYPVGPPANEFETIYIAYSESSASGRNDGVYTFPTDLTENVVLYASVDLDYERDTPIARARYGEGQYSSSLYGQEDTASLATWETASLKLYKNNILLSTSSFYNLSASITAESGVHIDITQSVSAGGFVTGDKIKLSLEVENTQSGFNAAVVAKDYYLAIDAPVPPTSDLIPVTFNNSLEITDDCQPTINNVVGDRPNKRLQDVDYSVDVNSPINFDQIIKDEAVRATVPESNFTQLGFANQRYFGSSTSRRNINEYNANDEVDNNNKQFYATDKLPSLINKGKGPKLGKEPNIELKNGYIAYFNKVIDPYPVVNGKTAYYIKYLIDENGTVFDPTLSDINYSILEGTFKLQDYDLKSTRAKVSLQNIDQVKELSKLNEGISQTFKVGEYPVPILYSQTSSLGHTNNIILSGSPFYGTLGLGNDWTNFGMNVNSTQTQFQLNSSLGGDHRKETLDISSTNVEFASSDITLFDNNEVIPTSSFGSGFKIDFPQDPLGNPADTDGAALSDNFVLNGSLEFFSSTMPAKYKGSKDSWNTNAFNAYDDNDPYPDGRNPFTVNIKPYRNGSVNTNNFNVKSLELEIIQSPGTDNEYVYNRLTIGNPFNGQSAGYGYQWRKTSSGVQITPHAINLEKRILGDLLGGTWTNGSHRMDNAHLIGGGYTPKQGSTDNRIQGINAVAVVYKWILNFEFTNIKQADDFYLSLDGSWSFAKSNSSWSSIRRSKRPKDWFHHVNGRANVNDSDGVNDRGDFAWVGTFNPDVSTHNSDVTSFNTKPVLKYEVTSPLSANNQNQNGAPGPYWRRVPNTTDMLYMSSSVLNQAYGIFDEEGNNTNGKYYVQAKLDYNGDTNIVFPNTIEPNFIEFDPIQDPWSLQIGDEIRFENNENLTYTITSLNGRQAVIPPSNPDSTSVNDKLQIVVSPPFEFTGSDGSISTLEPSNFDFFVVRRYKENRNFIILNQQTPYGFPTTGSLEPASSPGILLPEHRIEKYDRNPDEVLKDLIEKRII